MDTKFIASCSSRVNNDPIYTIYSADGEKAYTVFQGKYLIHCTDRWGKVRGRKLPENAKLVRANIDAAIAKFISKAQEKWGIDFVSAIF